MSRRRDEETWEERVARFVRAPRRVVSLDNVRRIESRDPKPSTNTNKETTSHD